MLRKKQFITIVSVAVISFLIGTTFNVITMATDGGNPFDNIWEAIYGLQTEFTELKGNVTRMIRLCDNGTYFLEEDMSMSVNMSCASFNFPVSVLCSFEARGATPEQMDCFYWQLIIHWGSGLRNVSLLYGYDDKDNDDQWIRFFTTECIHATSEGKMPVDSSGYTFELSLRASTGNFYIRNINWIIEVADGLPASN